MGSGQEEQHVWSPRDCALGGKIWGGGARTVLKVCLQYFYNYPWARERKKMEGKPAVPSRCDGVSLNFLSVI